MSSRSCIERSRMTSAGSSVIGVSWRSLAQSAREKVRYGETSCSVRCSIRIASAALARRFFVEARLTGARAKFGLDLVEADAAGMQHNQQVIEHVGRFADQTRFILADRGDDRLDRFFAEFLGALGDA